MYISESRGNDLFRDAPYGKCSARDVRGDQRSSAVVGWDAYKKCTAAAPPTFSSAGPETDFPCLFKNISVYYVVGHAR